MSWGDNELGITEEMRARWAAEDAEGRRTELIVRIYIWTGLIVLLIGIMWGAL